jgi:putative transposase
METSSVRKTYKYKLEPTLEQAQVLDTTVYRCRTLYNGALEQRKTWWERGEGKSATYYQQKAELPDVKAGCPEFADVHSQVLQDVIQRVDRSFQAFFWSGLRPRRECGGQYPPGWAGPPGANVAGYRMRSLGSPRL